MSPARARVCSSLARALAGCHELPPGNPDFLLLSRIVNETAVIGWLVAYSRGLIAEEEPLPSSQLLP